MQKKQPQIKRGSFSDHLTCERLGYLPRYADDF